MLPRRLLNTSSPEGPEGTTCRPKRCPIAGGMVPFGAGEALVTAIGSRDRPDSRHQSARNLRQVLYLHRSSRADHLVSALGDILLEPLPDPMAREVVAVPTRGVERWLTQRLSHRLGARTGESDGVSANIDFPSPGH